MEQTDVPKRRRWKFRRHGITQKKEYNIVIFVRNSQVSPVCPLLKSSFEDEDKYGAVVPPKNKPKLIFWPMSPRYPKEHSFVFGSQSSPPCPSATYLPN